ncbi:hypothetical protein Micbo1qcDRAFT_38369 [Microdochium bolleyi]|uniref:Uncharacterized protein n=1 Tax=Microdochium bolleyi TaxID=196109 RepID=A0A136J9A0_9PEZI|nr:hypothetical protein Micbo1qcDRAFT_38369 [Microdochium bolleyi]
MPGSERNPARPFEWLPHRPDEGTPAIRTPYEWYSSGRTHEEISARQPAKSYLSKSSGCSSYWAPVTVELRHPGWPKTPLIQGTRPSPSVVKFRISGSVPDDEDAQLVFAYRSLPCSEDDDALALCQVSVNSETRKIEYPISHMLALAPGQYEMFIDFWIPGTEPVTVLDDLIFEVVRGVGEQGPGRAGGEQKMGKRGTI